MVSCIRDSPLPNYTGQSNFLLISLQNQPTVYIRIANPSRRARQGEWASCLAWAGRVTLAGGTTVLYINALARLTRRTLGVASVT